MSLYLGNTLIDKVSVSFTGSSGGGNTTIENGTLANPTINTSTGVVTSSVSKAGYIDTSATTTLQLSTQAAKTITPSSSAQTAVSAGKYTTGNITVAAVPTETKSVTANGTYNPTSGKYFSQVTVDVPSSGIDTSDATATASDIADGVTAYVNGEKITGTVTTVNSNNTGSMSFYYADFQSANNSIRIQVEAKSDKLYRKGSYCNVYVPGHSFGNASPKDVAAGKTFTSSNGLKITGTATTETSTPTLQSKSVTPTESEQVVTPDTDYDGLSSVTVGAISSTYVGSGITRKSAATITPSTTDQTIAAGQYLSGAQTIKGDKNLVPNNIISGKSIFGVSGNVVIQHYYTGSSEPSSSLGNDGDIYLKS